MKTSLVNRLRKQWRNRKVDAVEHYYQELQENSTHPFEDFGEGFYYLSLRSDKFAFGIATIIVAIICYGCFCGLIGSYSFPLVLFLMTLGYGFFCIYGNTSEKELIINRYSGYIVRVKGNEKIIVEEPINNIYIKLQRKFDTNILPHYYLILGGYRLDDVRLTGFSMNDTALRILGGAVAARIGVNFFDVDNNSTLHKIYHYPSKSLLQPPEIEYVRFIQLHNLTERDIQEAALEEHMLEDPIHVPQQIVSKILQDYGVRRTDKHGLAYRAAPTHYSHMDNHRQPTLTALLDTDEARLKIGGVGAKTYASKDIVKKQHQLEKDRMPI